MKIKRLPFAGLLFGQEALNTLTFSADEVVLDRGHRSFGRNKNMPFWDIHPMTLTYISALALLSIFYSTGLTSPSPLNLAEMHTAIRHVVAKNQIADGAGFDPSLLEYGPAEPWHCLLSEPGWTAIQFFHHQLKLKQCGTPHSITPE